MSRSKGVVASYSSKNGYGFITDNETGDNLFVHQNDIDMEGFRHLNQGEDVEYDIEESEKGLKAIDVVVLSERKERKQRHNGHRGHHQHGGYGYPPAPPPMPPRSNFVSTEEHAKVKSDLRKLQVKFDRLVEVLGGSEEPVLDEDEIKIVTGNEAVSAG